MIKTVLLEEAASAFLDLENRARVEGAAPIETLHRQHLLSANIAALDLIKMGPEKIHLLTRRGVLHSLTDETLFLSRRIFVEYMRSRRKTVTRQDCFSLSTTCYSAIEAYQAGEIKLPYLNPF